MNLDKLKTVLKNRRAQVSLGVTTGVILLFAVFGAPWWLVLPGILIVGAVLLTIALLADKGIQ